MCGSLRKAVREWNNGLAPYHTDLDEYARSVILNRLWYSYSRQAFTNDRGIQLERHSNGFYYTVDRKLVLRFKHVDEVYRTSNYPTRRSLAWNAQMQFPNMPPLVKLDLGYRMDLTGTVVRDAVIALNFNQQSVWRWQIWGHRISEFAASPRDMHGRLVYSHNDFSGVAIP